MNTFLTISCILFIFGEAAVVIWWIRTDQKYYPVTLKKIGFNLLPFIFLTPFAFTLYSNSKKFEKEEIAGKIIYIEYHTRTSFIVNPDSVEIPLSFSARGLEIGDSFYEPPNASGAFSYHFFKKDSSGVFKEIEFVPNGNSETDWRFKTNY